MMVPLSSTDPALPLGDVRVVELAGGGVAAAYATRLLADVGATVIRAESPTEPLPDRDGVSAQPSGDSAPNSASFERALELELLRNKRRVGVDPDGDPAGWRKLVEWADILVMQDVDDLEAVAGSRPEGLIVLDIVHFGRSGPRAGWKGSELIDVAYGGGCQQNGEPGRAPLRPPPYVGEHEVGVNAAVAALIALEARRADGRGQVVEVSGVDSWATIQTAIGLLEYIFQGRVAMRAGRRFAGRPYPYGILPCRDGEARLICLVGREWARSVEMMGDPEWAHEPRFADRLTNQARHADELDRLVGTWLATVTTDELLATAIDHRVPWAPIRTVAEVPREPQLRERGYMWSYSGVEVPGFPALLSRSPARLRSEPELHAVRLAEMQSELRPRERADMPTRSSATPRLPLAGLRVLDFGWAWAGGVVGSVLADFGADVIKVESRRRLDPMRMDRPLLGGEDGTEQSALHHNVNRNKRSIAVDISSAEGAALVRRLVAKSDILIENLSPGTLERHGLGYEVLAQDNPGLIFLALSAAGASGPIAEVRAYAPVLTALSGIDALTGYPDEPIVGLQHGIADPNASLHGVFAILAALNERHRSGSGQYVDASQLDALVALVAPHVVVAQLGAQPRPLGNRDPLMAPHGVFPSSGEDEWIAVAITDDQAWVAFKTALGNPAWADDPALDTLDGRRAHESRLEAEIAQWSRTQGRWQAAELLQAHGVAAAPLLNTADRLADEQLQARELYASIEHPVVGTEYIYGVPWRLSRTPGAIRSAAPLLGQDTSAVLSELLALEGPEVAPLLTSGVLR